MGKGIPYPLKKTVIKEWLQGIPRDTISSNNGIGGGTVSRTIEESRMNTPDIDMLRGGRGKIKQGKSGHKPFRLVR